MPTTLCPHPRPTSPHSKWCSGINLHSSRPWRRKSGYLLQPSWSSGAWVCGSEPVKLSSSRQQATRDRQTATAGPLQPTVQDKVYGCPQRTYLCAILHVSWRQNSSVLSPSRKLLMTLLLSSPSLGLPESTPLSMSAASNRSSRALWLPPLGPLLPPESLRDSRPTRLKDCWRQDVGVADTSTWWTGRATDRRSGHGFPPETSSTPNSLKTFDKRNPQGPGPPGVGR